MVAGGRVRAPRRAAKHDRESARRVLQEEMDLTRKLHNAVRTWLQREAVGAADAESALAEVYRRWPAPSPSAGFARKVLETAGLTPAVRWVPAWVWRWSFAAGLVLTLAAGLQLVTLVGVAERSGWLAELAAGTLVFLGRRLADLEAAGSALLRAGELLAGALDSPWTLGLSLVAMLLSAAAFLGLQSLLAWDRSAGYANS